MHTKLTMTDGIKSLGEMGVLFWKMTSMATVALLGIIDFLTGYEISFSLFYLVPISAASWFVGRRWGLVISSVSAVTWIIADVTGGHEYSSPLTYLWNTLIRFGFFTIVTLLLASLRESYQREQDMARTDRTTGAANSRYFYELAELELERARRSGRPFAIAYIDLDNFKLVNDQFGHSQGDAVLIEVASTTRGHLRTNDVIARLGGDEFIVLLPETNQEGAQAAISKIQNDLLQKMHSRNWPVTFSIGVVTYTTPPASVDAMVHAADELMYSVKTSNKNGVSYQMRAG